MDSLRGQQLEQIIALSRQMLESAQAMAWERVAELEAQRKQLVISCFRQPASGQDAPQVAASIREVLRLNDRICELGSECRKRLGDQIRLHNVGRNASAAYLNHTG